MYYQDKEQFKQLNGYTINGVWYPRVTKIVEIKAKPALYRFYGEAETFADGERIKRNSAVQGTLIHNTVEKILVGESPEIDPAILPAIQAFKQFLNQTKIQVIPEFVERRIINHQEGYAGTIDALAIIDNKLGILDLKTSQAIYRDYNLQTAAYFGALKPQIPELSTRWILRIDQIQVCKKCGAILRNKGGRKKIRGEKNNEDCKHLWSEIKGDIELKEFPYRKEDYQAFLAAKKLWEWENEYWLKKIGYL